MLDATAALPHGPDRRALRRLCRTGLRRTGGVFLGSVTGLLDLGYLLGCVPFLALAAVHPGTRAAALRASEAGALRLAKLERRRLRTFLDSADHTFLDGADAAGHSGRRALAYLAVRWPVGLLGGLVLLLLGYGLVTGVVWVWHWLIGRTTGYTFASEVVVGLALAFIVGHGLAGLIRLDRRVGRWFLGPSGRELLRRRISELTTSRAGVVAAVDTERRRIERDLHDGVQQRLVALGMLVGRARRSTDPVKARDLLRQAHEESQQALDELREVAWRVYPTALDNLGLAEALARVAEHAGLPVRVDYRLTDRPPRAVETAAYFVISEAVTNAAKHARATRVDVTVTARDGTLLITVRDDGVGGADPDGVGLSGLARRVAALDGRLWVRSPAGGPTTIDAELPCG